MLEEPSTALASPTLPIGVHFLRGLVLIRLHGDLTQEISADVEALSRGLAAEHLPIVINVGAVSSMDTSGLRWLMRLTQGARRQGLPLILESPTPSVEAVLTLTGCHTWFTAATRPGPNGRRDTVRLIAAESI